MTRPSRPPRPSLGLLVPALMLFTACSEGDASAAGGGPDDSGIGGAASFVPDYFPTDDWREKASEDVGMDPAALDAAVSYAFESSTQGFLVVKDGYVVAERYEAPFTADTRHESFSMAKSFTSGLVGIAIDEGLLPGVEVKVCDYYDQWSCDDSADPRSRITLRHLMTLTSGLAWSEEWTAAGIATNDAVRMSGAPSAVDYVLSKEGAAEPGTVFQYSTGDPALVTGFLSQAAGKTALEYAREKVFAVIGTPDIQWNQDQSGETTTYAGMRATVREFAKYGFLFLNRGNWDGQQVVPAAWVDTSTRTGLSLEPWYGYLWHVDLKQRFEDDRLPSDGYLALGVFGQHIVVIPSAGLVIVRVAEDSLEPTDFTSGEMIHRVLSAVR